MELSDRIRQFQQEAGLSEGELLEAILVALDGFASLGTISATEFVGDLKRNAKN